jgi:TonB family protein
MILKLLFLGILAAFPVVISAQQQLSPSFRCTITHFPPPGEINCFSVSYKTVGTGADSLNKNAIDLPAPVYPEGITDRTVRGRVTVRVVVDEFGDVIFVAPVSGHPLLRAAAGAAARKAKFPPRTAEVGPAKFFGTLVYIFTLPPRKKLAKPPVR